MAVAPGLVDIQQIPLYDTATVAAAAATGNPVQFFVVPIGGAKQRNQTNLTQAQRLEAPRSFEVHAVRLYVQEDIGQADWFSLNQNYVLSLIVGEKEYQLGPLWYFPAGGGLWRGGVATTAAATTISGLSNGVPDPRAINLIHAQYVVRIEQGENFRVELQGTSFTAVAAIRLVCLLDGILTRQVQ
ncbi:hypothetical protein EPO44_10170 [bacterium]|nr:MAG: hypothetical protein EPO44_10170 [bacterium]